MPRKSEQEWAIIENEYATMPVTYNDLSIKYGLSINALSVRGIKDKWEIKRQRFKENACRIIQDDKANGIAKDNYDVINELERLRKCKIKAELAAFERIFKLFEATASINPLQLMQLVNKSKDSITETSKIIELLKGNATDRLDFHEQDTEARNTRLNVLGFNN